MRADDGRFMALAIRMAERGLGTTSPNPSVGVVMVGTEAGDAVVVARGWTAPGGRPHAETQALARAGAAAKGATLYVTLEPCAHHGRTPPCADAIIAAGIARVVAGTGDPDPRTAGEGFARLRAAGIEVVERVMEPEARWVTLGHILRQTERRPFVQLKMALDTEGAIARGTDGRPVWVTGPEARAMGHLLRAEADAILIGAGTLREDDPELTCRLPGLKDRTPLRVVLDPSLSIQPAAKLLRTAGRHPVLVMHAEAADPERAEVLRRAGVRLMPIPNGAGHLDLRQVLAFLAEEGITRLLVEGGPTLWRSVLSAGLADEVVVFRQGPAPMSPGLIDPYGPTNGLVMMHEAAIGGDREGIFRRAPAV
ncbi:MAG: bifunctional diaminohydroxyphosphoribosylaminopyrimidine deaminase/5-amino-6-(5-phosphoribosylamino)uracil reductase RibD [Hyphomicrobiaceae bacterium]